MKGVIFRGKRLIDREDEAAFIKEWINKLPDEILWIYGPKSSGKTTLIEYIVENELFEDFWNFIPNNNYWVRYINLRGYLITSYKTFLEAFIKPAKETKRKEEKIFRVIAKVISEKGCFEILDNFEHKAEYVKVIDKWAEKEIFFFDPVTLKVNGNSRIYEKGMQLLADI